MPELAQKKCVPCMIGTPPMAEKISRELLKQIVNWELIENASKISKEFRFKDFKETMVFVNKVAQLCEQEGHHADFFISYRVVRLTIFTHKINGLTESDFVLAAKIDKL